MVIFKIESQHEYVVRSQFVYILLLRKGMNIIIMRIVNTIYKLCTLVILVFFFLFISYIIFSYIYNKIDIINDIHDIIDKFTKKNKP